VLQRPLQPLRLELEDVALRLRGGAVRAFEVDLQVGQVAADRVELGLQLQPLR
jgi:hypothetical protein